MPHGRFVPAFEEFKIRNAPWWWNMRYDPTDPFRLKTPVLLAASARVATMEEAFSRRACQGWPRRGADAGGEVLLKHANAVFANWNARNADLFYASGLKGRASLRLLATPRPPPFLVDGPPSWRKTWMSSWKKISGDIKRHPRGVGDLGLVAISTWKGWTSHRCFRDESS